MAESIFQTPWWAELKSKGGWQQKEIAGVSVLIRKLPLGLAMAYVPEVSNKDWQSWLPQFAESLRHLSGHRLVFARLEILEPNDNTQLLDILSKQKFIKSFEEVQPEWRQIINITGTEQEILNSMKPKGRYNIRLAQKHGMQIDIYSDPQRVTQDAELFHKLMSATGSRQRFSIRPVIYFQNLLSTLYTNKAGVLVVARYNGEPLAALIISFWDGVASYLYGASSEANRALMAPYLAHWAAIQEAKRHNCQTYDLLAVAPAEQPHHKYASLSRFKQQFGGQTVHLIGSWDLIFHPIWYTMYCLAEKHRRHI